MGVASSGMDEESARFGPDSAARAAKRWLELVLVEFADADIASAWPLATRSLRLALVQALAWDHWDHDALDPVDGDMDVVRAEMNKVFGELAADHPSHPMWPETSLGVLLAIRDRWLGWLGGPSDLTASPRVIDPHRELVVFLKKAQAGMPPDDFALPMLMERAGTEWLVAGFSEHPPEPGWPPLFPDGR